MVLPAGQFTFNPLRIVGQGGLGIVEEIEILESNCTLPVGSRWARKRLNEKWRQNPASRERFEREIAAIAQMNHGRIVPFKGENLPGQERFYVMPLYQQSLRNVINRNTGGHLWHAVAGFGATIANAVHYAHEKGYIHRDLKPENIMFDSMSSPVITDWGLGYFIHKDSKVLDMTVGGMGTEYYCSAEQWLTGKCGPPGDIYSLGMLLAEVARGRQVPITQCDGIKVDVVGNCVVQSCRDFNAYIKRMTAARSAARPQSMAEVVKELSRIEYLGAMRQ